MRTVHQRADFVRSLNNHKVIIFSQFEYLAEQAVPLR